MGSYIYDTKGEWRREGWWVGEEELCVEVGNQVCDGDGNGLFVVTILEYYVVVGD